MGVSTRPFGSREFAYGARTELASLEVRAQPPCNPPTMPVAKDVPIEPVPPQRDIRGHVAM